MLVTHSGPQLPSALCIQHGAVAPRGREGGRKEDGKRGRERVCERERERGEAKRRETKACYGHATKHHPTVTHTHCTHKRQLNNLNSNTYSKFPGSVFVCLYEQERESNGPVCVTDSNEIQLPFT